MNYDVYYQEKLKEGQEFQDFVVEVLSHEYDIIIQLTTSQKYQYKKGESLQNIEIKRDGKFRTTGNLYIETHEKKPQATIWIPSGINRQPLFYVIGDENTFYFFATRHLFQIYEQIQKQSPQLVVEIPTSRGFKLPLFKAEDICCFKYEKKV